MESLERIDNVLGDYIGFVELQDMMPNPLNGIDEHEADRSVVQAARVSFLGESKGDEADKKLLFFLLEHHHTTPFEQVEFKFRVKAPVVVWWQWVRHRTWHYNFQSGRYTEFQDKSFYIPSEWRLQSQTNKQGSEGMVDGPVNLLMTRRMEILAADAFNYYELALQEGIAKEQARFFLPAWTSYYTAICKVDAWNLMNFLRLRTALEAQWEIRQYANALHTIFAEFMPWASEAFDKFILNT
jgi:thymidylate synthase (FAD)